MPLVSVVDGPLEKTWTPFVPPTPRLLPVAGVDEHRGVGRRAGVGVAAAIDTAGEADARAIAAGGAGSGINRNGRRRACGKTSERDGADGSGPARIRVLDCQGALHVGERAATTWCCRWCRNAAAAEEQVAHRAETGAGLQRAAIEIDLADLIGRPGGVAERGIVRNIQRAGGDDRCRKNPNCWRSPEE